MNTAVFSSLSLLLLWDLVLLVILGAVVATLARVKRASFALVRRNFVGYFTNPTGYVFLCIFMFLTSLAAFWPYEFFNSNLATLDQLNRYFPLIMLFFISAITMSIWAEEKRQGTDELLLTLPADDFDIVIGKYLAAGAIFTASLLFSQIANFITMALLTRGEVDVGLFFTNYLGYWFVGMTMIAIGMVASFLTGNLTVSFILGALFNAPLAFASLSDAVVPNAWLADLATNAGISAQFDDFGRGVISIASISYFVLVAVVGLYACMVLIGRRHWTGGEDGNAMFWHYLARTLALVLIAGAVVTLLRSNDRIRIDATEGGVSSLSPATKKLIRDLKGDQPISVDAYISNNVPELYARTRYEVISLLKEFKAEAARQGKKINLNLYTDIELFSEEAKQAEDRFGIVPQSRIVRSQGALRNERIILGAAFRSGLEKVVVPFFESGIPVEYEMVRSINTVSREKRKKLGIVKTDAQLMGGFSFSGMSPQQTPKNPIVDELQKQYDVEEVTLDGPVAPGQYDVLLAVQPSSLGPEQLSRLVEAVRKGVPTAIFEDPMPYGTSMPGTGEPKQSPGGMFGGGGQQIPKGDIKELWNVLELEIPGSADFGGLYNSSLVFQRYNPYPKMSGLGVNDLWIFAREEAPGALDALSEANPVTSGLNEVLFLFTGAVKGKKDGELKHTPLVSSGSLAGLVSGSEARPLIEQPAALATKLGLPSGIQTVAMAISGPSPEQANKEAEKETTTSEASKAEKSDSPVKAIYVADADVMLPVFLQIRATPEQFAEINFRFDNVTFLLNTIDWLAGELDQITVRKHQPRFSTLRVIEEIENEARAEEESTRVDAQQKLDQEMRDADEKVDEEITKLQARLDDMQKKSQDGSVSFAELQAVNLEFQTKKQQLERARDVKRAKLERERDRTIGRVRRQADLDVQKKQNYIKLVAVALPCIPPLLVGIVVFAQRRLRERETIAKVRLR